MANDPAFRDEVVQIAWHATEKSVPTNYYVGTEEPKEPDFAFIVRDLRTRIETLQKAGARVIVRADGNALVLETVRRIPAPVAVTITAAGSAIDQLRVVEKTAEAAATKVARQRPRRSPRKA